MRTFLSLLELFTERPPTNDMISTVLLTASLILGTVSAVTCPPSSTCPDNDKCTFTSGGVSFAVTCATDFYGGDLQVAQVSPSPPSRLEDVFYAGKKLTEVRRLLLLDV